MLEEKDSLGTLHPICFYELVIKMPRTKWKCLDCKVDTGKIGEHYFVETSLWLKATSSIKGMLCITCLETRIGRKLVQSDFTDCYLNDPKQGSKSSRFLSRLHNK